MLSILIELQRLKNLERTGWMLRGLPPGSESIADHSFGVAVTAMLLADEIKSRGVEVAVERVLRMAIMHDWAEALVGDLPRTATNYFGQEARANAERQAFADMTNSLSEAVKEKYRALNEAYEKRACLESRIVKAADVVDLLIQTLAFERAGLRGLDEFWESATIMDFKLDSIANEVVSEVIQAIVNERSKLG
jgi:putative hydrolase of HD superfamily